MKLTEAKYRRQIYEQLNRTLECHLVHGANEHGIDILAKTQDIFSEARYIGISVKIGDITCRGLATVIRQLIISSYYKDPYSQHYLDAVYIVTNGCIKPEAKSQINSINIPYRNIYFIEGTQMKNFLNTPDTGFSGETPKII